MARGSGLEVDISDHGLPEPDTLLGYRLFRLVSIAGPLVAGASAVGLEYLVVPGVAPLNIWLTGLFFVALSLFDWRFLRWAVSQWAVKIIVSEDGTRVIRRNGKVLVCRWGDSAVSYTIVHYVEGGQHLQGLWISIKNRGLPVWDTITEPGFDRLRQVAEARGYNVKREEPPKRSGVDWMLKIECGQPRLHSKPLA